METRDKEVAMQTLQLTTAVYRCCGVGDTAAAAAAAAAGGSF